MRMVVVGLALAVAFVGAAPARAQTIGAAHVTSDLGATLLLPYFEAQVPKKIGGKAPGVTTLFSINNSSATAILAHVTLWSDHAVPVFAFNVYLTGYDIQTIDMVDLLNGKLPRTASAGQDPGDTSDPTTGISNRGLYSQDINFASCNGKLPPPDVLPVDTINHIRASLTGKPSALLAGQCTGRDYAEKKPIARGFVTVDAVNNCTERFPSDTGYFIDGGGGDATNQNVLWGDYFFLNKSKRVGRGDGMVAIRASATDPETSGGGDYSFYGRITQFTTGTAADNRQPLSSTFAGHFVNAPKHPIFPTGTSIIVWRDPKVSQEPFACGSSPVWFPLGQNQLVAFDEQENPELLGVAPFPIASQIVKIGGPALPITQPGGWLFMNLNASVQGASVVPLENPNAAQAFVAMVKDSKGKYSVGVRATVLDDAAVSNNLTLPLP